MFSVLVLVVLVSLLAVPAVNAQAPAEAPSFIRVTGTGTAYAPPDIAYVMGGVEVMNEDVTAAVNDANDRINAVTAALAALGVAEGDIRTVGFYIYREQFYGPEGPTGEGQFRVSNQLEVTVRDTSLVPQVVSAMLEAGANSINNVSFNVADNAGLESQARELAVADARAVAEELAGLMGVSVGEVISVTEISGGGVVPPMYAGGYGGGGGGAPAAPPPIEGGSLAVLVSVEVTFAIVR
jgi:hypothetical protein